MSTRRGKVVFLRDVLDEAKSRVIESMRARSSEFVDSFLYPFTSILCCDSHKRDNLVLNYAIGIALLVASHTIL